MQFFYGSYYHDLNSVAFTGVTNSFIRSQNGRPHLIRKSWSCKGKIVRWSQAEIFNQLTQLQLAYSINGQSAGLLDNSGQLTPFLLDSSTALGGVIVAEPISHDEISGAHGTTFLRYKFALQADYLWSGPTDVLSFAESVSFTNNDGGPIQVERIPATGRPILQNVTETSFYYATQSGSLSQSGPNPQPMNPDRIRHPVEIRFYLGRSDYGGTECEVTSPKGTKVNSQGCKPLEIDQSIYLSRNAATDRLREVPYTTLARGYLRISATITPLGFWDPLAFFSRGSRPWLFTFVPLGLR